MVQGTGIIQLKQKYYRRAMLWSVLAVLAIPMIIAGAILLTKSGWWGILLGAGVLILFSGFYGIPLMWIGYANKKRLARIAVVVSSTQSVTIDILSDTIGRTQEETRQDVRTLLQNGWLPGYAYVDQEDRVKATSTLDIHHAVCDYCHASFEFRGTDSRCPYCGRWFTGEPID